MKASVGSGVNRLNGTRGARTRRRAHTKTAKAQRERVNRYKAQMARAKEKRHA